MSTIKGSRTEKNLLAAFAGESQARNRYTYFAKVAKKEGYEQISALFLDTAENEMIHAKRFFSFLEGGDVEITASYPAGVIGTTVENLAAAAAGEHHEHTTLYPGFARIAQEEGFDDVAFLFKAVSVAETHHEKRFLALKESIDKGTVFKKDQPATWRCRHCGYVAQSTEPPPKCPACEHPKGYFEIYCENF